MSSTQTETANYSAGFLTRLYVAALSGIAILLIGGQVITQQSIFRNSSDARVLNMAGRQRAFSQRIAKCAEAIDFADNQKTAEFYTSDLQRAVKQCTEEHELLQYGPDSATSNQDKNSQVHVLFSKIEPAYQSMIKSARAIIARQRVEPFNPDKDKHTSSYTKEILAAEPVVLDGMENVLNQLVLESGGRSDDLAQTELSLLLATLLCLLLVGVVIFRPAIEQIRAVMTAMESMQNRLDGTLSSMGEALFQVDKSGDIVFANKTFAELVGYTLPEVIGKNVHSLLHKIDENHSGSCPFISATMFNDEVRITDDVFRHKDGHQFPVEIVSSPMMRRDERVGAVVTFRDMTEHRLLQRRLSAQHAITLILQTATSVEEALPKVLATLCECLELDVGGVWLVDPAANVLKLAAFQRPEGEKFEQFEKKTKSCTFAYGSGLPGVVWKNKEPFYVPDVSGSTDIILRYAEADTAALKSAFAFPIIQSQKVLGVIDFFGTKVREPDEQLLTLVSSMAGMIGEFIQRRRTQLSLRTSESRLTAIINSMAEGVIVADVNGSFLLINQAAKNMHRTSSAQTSVSNWTKLFGYFAQDQKTPLPNDEIPLLKAIRGESIDNMEIYLQPFGGDDGLWISCTARPLRDESGGLIGGVVVLNDVTERKTAEKRLSEFYSTVSHELRTPLTSIKAALGLLEGGIAGQLSTKAMQLVTVGRSESDRLVRLINDILDVKKMEEGKFELSVTELDMKELIEQSIAGVEAFAGQAGVKVRTDFVDRTLISGDRDRITQVLYNLLSNAIKYSPEGGTVVVKTESKDDVMRVSVSDRGRGIAEDQIHLLFGMFQQIGGGDSSRIPGTGLGLAICKKIVELHDGKIGIDSTVDKGSTFWFELPIRRTSPVLS